ncbi:MAG: ATP synthase F1 subunit delta [Thermoanaerobaculia bacterium]
MIRRFARPYAKAMMDLAGDARRAKAVHGELARFEEARRGSAELRDLFENPGFETEVKIRVARDIAGRLGVSDLGMRLIDVLVRHNRINDTGAVLEAWAEMINAALGIAVAEVRTAHPLDEAEAERLREALRARLGRDVELAVSTDASLLGGFVARIESEVWDASVRGRLEKFKTALSH